MADEGLDGPQKQLTDNGDGLVEETEENNDRKTPVENLEESELEASNVAVDNNEAEDNINKNPESDYESLDERYASESEHQIVDSCSDPCCSEEGGQEDMAHLVEGDDIDDPDWEEEREEGDGEESEVLQSKEKSLDFDEDRRNPQYIPKKGGFYEHDDRLGLEEALEEEKKGSVKGGKKKKLWRDEGLWKHDRFHVEEQNPKSKEELVTVYGYDIRNEDGPPRARRRRRYGRGPSKYTRNWEDEQAYVKTSARRGDDDGGGEDDTMGTRISRGGFRGGRRGSRSLFRGRGGRGRGGEASGSSVRRHDLEQEEEEDLDLSRPPAMSRLTRASDDDDEQREGSVEAKGDDEDVIADAVEDAEGYHSDGGRPEDRDSSSAMNASDSVCRTTANLTKSSPECVTGTVVSRRDVVGKGSRRNYGRSMRSRGSNTRFGVDRVDPVNDLSTDVAKLCVTQSRAKSFNNNNTQVQEGRKEAKVAPTQHNAGSHERRQAAVPPRLQDSVASRPKRYSSQRQRQGADLMPPYPQQQQSSSGRSPSNASLPPRFYDSGYQQPPQMYAELPNQSNSQQGPAQIIPQHYQSYDASYQEAYAIRPMASPPRMFNPVSLAAGQPVIPAPYIAPTGNILSYGPPPAAYTPQYQFQQYPPSTSSVNDHLDNSLTSLPPQPQEIFRCGMAYYNAPPPVRTIPKRPRAAIPIVPPPELEMQEQRKDDGEECRDNIDAHSYSQEQVTNVDN